MADEKQAGAAAPAATEQAWPIKVKLRKPITAYGEPVTELSIREPTAGDMEASGDPVFYDFTFDPPQLRLHTKNMASMISALATIPPSSVKLLHPKDWKNVAYEIAPFFTPDGVGVT